MFTNLIMRLLTLPRVKAFDDHADDALAVANDSAPADGWSPNHPAVAAAFARWERELADNSGWPAPR